MHFESEFHIALYIVILIGILGNILNVFVFYQKGSREIPTFQLLLYQSIINLFLLLFCTNEIILNFSFKLNVISISTYICKFHIFFANFLTNLSSIVMTFTSIERILMVYIAKIKRFEESHIKKAIIIIISVQVLLNIHYFIWFNLKKENEFQHNFLAAFTIQKTNYSSKVEEILFKYSGKFNKNQEIFKGNIFPL